MSNKIAGASIRIVKPKFQPGEATSHVPKPKSGDGDTFVKASSDASLTVEKSRVAGSFEMDTQGSGSLSFSNEVRLRAASDTSNSESEPSAHSGLQSRLDNVTERFGLKREMEVDVHLGNDTIGLDLEGKATIAANGIEAQGNVEARAGVGIEMEAHLNVGIAEAEAAANASAIAIAKADASLKADLTGVSYPRLKALGLPLFRIGGEASCFNHQTCSHMMDSTEKVQDESRGFCVHRR